MKKRLFSVLVISIGISTIVGCPAVEPQTPVNGPYISPHIGKMIYIPAGSFQRDSTPTNISIIAKPFRMSQYEITRKQFSDLMGGDPSELTWSSGTSDPLQQLSWYQAIAFCNKLSLTEGFSPVYSVTGIDFSTIPYALIPTAKNTIWDAATANWSANGYRLPTEMEWMWAAMGAKNDYTKAFAGSTGSNSCGDYVWYSDNSNGTTHPVGQKHANELGIFDMSGNSWEWCWDWYLDPYPSGTISSDTTNGRGATSGTDRVCRGGSWKNPAINCTIAIRSYLDMFGPGNFVGIRVVRP